MEALPIKRRIVALVSLSLLFTQIICTNAKTTLNEDKRCNLTLRLRNETHGTIKLYSIAHYSKGKLEINRELLDNVRLSGHNDNLSSKKIATIVKSKKVSFIQKDIKNGKVMFCNLKSGKYLVMQNKTSRRFYSIKPFLVSLPQKISTGKLNFNVYGEPKVEQKKHENVSGNYYGDQEGNHSKDQEANKKTTVKAQAVQTGDDTPVEIYFILVALALYALVSYLKKKDKK